MQPLGLNVSTISGPGSGDFWMLAALAPLDNDRGNLSGQISGDGYRPMPSAGVARASPSVASGNQRHDIPRVGDARTWERAAT